MNANPILDRNLLALNTRHPDLAEGLSREKASEQLSLIPSRKGPTVPVLTKDGRPYYLHSRFDPLAEGNRIADGAPGGFLVAFGLGGGYHLRPLLRKKTMTGLLIIEKDLQFIRGVLESIDMTDILSDSRIVLLADPDPATLNSFVLERYIPVLYGNLGSITLRSRWDTDPEWFAERAAVLKGLPEALGRDYTVQARFGRRWFVHTMANLPRSEEVSAMLPPSRKMLITAAGPSLEQQLPRIRRMKAAGATLLATDTSLPFLARSGLAPDVVLSIDCQVVSYHHFLAGLPDDTLLVLDLASPPVLTRQTDRILFFSSGHPFSLYLNRLYRPFPILDLSGGNVTHAALSLASVAGASEVHLFGADFSYPEGRPYARGTYLYPYFHSGSGRVSSGEHVFWKFISGSRPRKEQSGNTWRFRTASMDHYRESLEKTLDAGSLSVFPEAGDGVTLKVPEKGFETMAGSGGGIRRIVSAGSTNMPWNGFLDHYRSRLENLPPLTGPPQDYLEALEPEDRQAWATLLPSAATFRTDDSEGPAAVEEARLWTLDRIRTYVSRTGDSQRIVP